MTERIPTHQLLTDKASIPALKIFRFKNSDQLDSEPSPLPITPLPTDSPHRHSYYEILFIEQGSGFHEIDFLTYPIQGPGLHFLMPGQVHLLTLQGPCQGFIIAFSEEYFSFYNPDSPGMTNFPFFRAKQRQAVIPLADSERKYFHNVMENMVSDHLLPASEQLLTGKYLGLLLQKGASIARKHEPESALTFALPELVVQFQELTEKRYQSQHDVQSYADTIGVSADYLSKSVKKHLGVSAGEYLQTKLLMEAKRLLVFTPMSSKEIAYTLHIEDPSYFGRLFKRKTGLTPNEYRQSVRKSATI